MPMVQLLRVEERVGEDEIGEPLPILINPEHVACVFASVEPNVVIVRLADGRPGLKVRGSFANIAARLGFAPQPPASPVEGTDAVN